MVPPAAGSFRNGHVAQKEPETATIDQSRPDEFLVEPQILLPAGGVLRQDEVVKIEA